MTNITNHSTTSSSPASRRSIDRMNVVNNNNNNNESTKENNSKIDESLPPADLTIFVEDLLEQMVRNVYLYRHYL